MEANLKKYAGSLPRVFLLEEEYLRDLARAELRWIQSVVSDLRNGALSWNREQLRKLAEQYAAGGTGAGAADAVPRGGRPARRKSP